MVVSSGSRMFFGSNMNSSTIKGNGDIRSERRNCEPFSSVNVNSVVSVELVSGDSYSIELQGDGNLLEYVISHVVDGELIVTMQDGIVFSSTRSLKAIVTVPEDGLSIRRVTVGGTGSFSSEPVIRADSVYLHLQGTGRINARLEVNQVNVMLNGTGDIALAGNCGYLQASLTGTGSLHAADLVSSNVNLNLSGTGHGKVYAKDVLIAILTGMGNLLYRGNPAKKSINSIGFGRVGMI